MIYALSNGFGKARMSKTIARFANIQADVGAGFGIFQELHGLASGCDLSKHFSSASRKYYGTPIRCPRTRLQQ